MNIISDFKTKLEDPTLSENHIQEFLENNTELFPTPFRLNHHLHFNVVISKFKISDSLICDFAYLTKSSDYWNLVLVEIEDPKKRIFTSNSEQINFTADFNHAIDQISEWKSYIDNNSEETKRRINSLKIPLEDNPIRFKYVLIYGRRNEKDNNTRRKRMFANKSNNDIMVLTFDSLISDYESSPHPYGKMILSHWREGFKIKSIPEKISTAIFAYLRPSTLKVDPEINKKLIEEGYQMDEWEKGQLLTYNHKYATFKRIYQ